MKTTVSLPAPLFQSAQRAAKRLAISRSELLARALARFVREIEGDDLTAAIDRALGAQASSLDTALRQMQSTSLGPDEGPLASWVAAAPKRRAKMRRG